MMLTLLLATWLTATPPAEAKEVSFVGFSRDESIVVWRLRVQRQTEDGRATDQFSLLRVVRVDGNQVLGDVREPGCVRRTARGAKHGCAGAGFAAANPDWAAAAEPAVFKRLRSRARLGGKALPLADSTVRLAADADLQLEMSRFSDRIEVRSAPGTAIGFTPVARLVDGRFVELGHFREPAPPAQPLSAQVRVYFSPPGTAVAVLNRYAPEGGAPIWEARAVRLPEALGTTAIGALRLAYSSMRVAEDIYKDAHPTMADLWNDFVGAASRPAAPR